MEACATAHHWARELIALGHEVKLMPPAYVKAYVNRNKNDAADAEAICEAVTRLSMRFVPVKNVAQQSMLMLHRARNLLVRQRTMLVNALRAHLAEFGVIAPQGLRHVEQLIAAIDADDLALPELARSILRLIAAQLNDTQAKVRQIEAKLAKWHRSDRVSILLKGCVFLAT
jgi:transposase